MKRLMMINSKIKLMLNPNEKGHIRLVELLGDDPDARKNNLEQHYNNVICSRQKLLERL